VALPSLVPRVMRHDVDPSARPRWPCLLPTRLVTAYLELVGKGHGRIPECRPTQNSIPSDTGVVTVSPSLSGVPVPLLLAPGLPSPPGRVCRTRRRSGPWHSRATAHSCVFLSPDERLSSTDVFEEHGTRRGSARQFLALSIVHKEISRKEICV